MRPGQEFKNLLNNTNYEISIIQASASAWYKSDGDNWHQDNTQFLRNTSLADAGTIIEHRYSTTGNHIYTTGLTSSGGSAPSTKAVNTDSIGYLNDYTVFCVRSGGGGSYWFKEDCYRPAAAMGLKCILQTSSSRMNYYRTWYNNNDAVQTKLVKIIDTDGASEYSTTGACISVLRYTEGSAVGGGTPYLNDPSIYATSNGRGTSTSLFHKAGSGTNITVGGSSVATNSDQIINLQGSVSVGGAHQTWDNMELITFRYALTQAQIDSIETYLRNKWGISY